MISPSAWVLVVMLAPNPGVHDTLSHDVFTFANKQTCEKMRNVYISIAAQYWLNTRSYVSSCFRGKD